MKSTKTIVLIGLAVVVLCGVVRVVVPYRPARPPTASTPAGVAREDGSARSTPRSAEPRVATPTLRPRPSSGENPAPSVSPPEPEAAKSAVQASVGEQKAAPVDGKTQKATQQANQGAPAVPEALQDPVARVALGFVGADPDAESYWYVAINDPRLSAHERQDLIEDLNEDGLSDPRHPTADDLPLILNRIQLIEEVIWDAMDQVNADAFLEAYKDLVNLAVVAMGNG